MAWMGGSVRRQNPDLIIARENAGISGKKAKSFEEFHGSDSKKTSEVWVPDCMDGMNLYCLGTMPDIAYDPPGHSAKAGPPFLHKFDKRPLLCAEDSGRILLILGGSFRITDRGIVG